MDGRPQFSLLPPELSDIETSMSRDSRPGVFFLDALIDLFPEDNGRYGGLYAQSDLLAPDLKDCDTDVIPDKDTFTAFSREN